MGAAQRRGGEKKNNGAVSTTAVAVFWATVFFAHLAQHVARSETMTLEPSTTPTEGDLTHTLNPKP